MTSGKVSPITGPRVEVHRAACLASGLIGCLSEASELGEACHHANQHTVSRVR